METETYVGLLSSGGDKHKTINRLITKNYKKLQIIQRIPNPPLATIMC